jgi:hypothetical protein
MDDLDDLLDELDEAEKTTKKKKKRPSPTSGFRFDSPLSSMSADKAVKAVKSGSRVGQYIRRTITVPPEQDAYIAEVADRESMGKLAMYRWLLDYALSRYEAGVRPEKEVVEKAKAKLKHWTSEG